MKRTLFFPAAVAATLVATSAAHADTILFEDFEDATVGYTPSAADDLSDASNKDYYGIATAADLPSDVSYSNTQGSGFYAVQDTDSAGIAVDDITLSFTGIDVSAFSNLTLSFFLAEDEASNGNEDWDISSSFQVSYQIDGGGFVTAFAVESELGTDGNLTNEKARVDSEFDGIGDGTEITDFFQQFAFTIPDAMSLDLNFLFTDLNAADEDLALDNILLTGDPVVVAAVPLPAGIWLMALALGGLGLARRRA